MWLVTGANRGIGLGIVERLVEKGEAVVAACRDPSDATALKAVAARPGAKVEIIALEVTDKASIAAARAAVGSRAIDVLINNAGVYGPRRQGVFEVDPDDLLEVLRVNTVAPIAVAQAFKPNLEAAGRGAKLVTISSTMGSLTSGGTGDFVYRASKAAINKAIQAAAPEFARAGITAVVMHPGWVRTDMGGSAASLSVEDSSRGIVRAVQGFTAADAGGFFLYDGSRAPW